MVVTRPCLARQDNHGDVDTVADAGISGGIVRVALVRILGQGAV